MKDPACSRFRCSRCRVKMIERTNPSRAEAWCGRWFDCTRCAASSLIPSPALTAQHKEQRDGNRSRA